MTDIIKRAEQWLEKPKPMNRLAEEMMVAYQIMRALVEALKQEREDFGSILSSTGHNPYIKLTGINPDWPGNPGEGD